MKKLVLLAAFAVFGFTQVNAQVKFGAKAGANLANIVGEDTDDTKMLLVSILVQLLNLQLQKIFLLPQSCYFPLKVPKRSTQLSVLM